MHCILTSVYVLVLGQGLSIHGPIGSMARAVEGMKYETKEMFVAYLIMVFFFALSMLMSFWVVMTARAAMICTFVFIVFGALWWKYCIRIYNRFFIATADMVFEVAQGEADENKDPTEESRRMAQRGAQGTDDKGNGPTSKSSQPVSSAPVAKKGLASMFKIVQSQSPAERDREVAASAAVAAEGLTANGTSSHHADTLQGYLYLDEIVVGGKHGNAKALSHAHGDNSVHSHSWNRRFFVLNEDGELNYYVSKRAFLDNPNDALRTRPLLLSELNVYGEKISSTSGVPDFELKLEYKDASEGRPWLLRCEGEEEFDHWFEVLSRVSRY